MNNELNNLEKHIDKLIKICRTLKEENLHLRIKNEGLRNDHIVLNKKTYLARTRLDSIIGRIKEAEPGAIDYG